MISELADYSEADILLDKNTSRTTLMILIDAFSKNYLSQKYTPFLYNLAQNGVISHVKPLFAFKGIETTIFTGVWPNVHNVWTEFCLRNNKINSKKERVLRELVKTANLLPNDAARVKLRYAIERYLFQRPHVTLNQIPSPAMAYFQQSQPRKITEAEAVGRIRTIFDVFRKKRIPFVFIEPWIGGDGRVLAKTKKLCEHDSRIRFWYLKLNSLDHLGHRYGPEPLAFSKKLEKTDKYAEEIVSLIRNRNPNLNVLILADHGMSKVRGTLNVTENMNQLESQMYKDYIAFIDSTLLRFWFFTEKARKEICEHLQQIKCGHILTSSEKELLRIPFDPKYGETIYILDEGYILHPCFFHSKSLVNGMHGYAYPRTAEALPLIIADGEFAEMFQTVEQIMYTDIAQSVLKSLQVDFSMA